MKIKIYKTSMNDSHRLYMNDAKRDYVIADNNKTSFSAERFKFKVMDMISDWKEKMVDSNVIDGIEYKITINEKDKEKVFLFQNKFPKDIYLLEMLIKEVVRGIHHESI